MTASDLVELLESYRFPTGTEAALSSAVRELLDKRGLSYQAEAQLFAGAPVRAVGDVPEGREVTLIAFGREVDVITLPGTERSRIDFLVGRIGLELKTDGGASDVTRQLARYALSDRVDALVLLTSKVRLCKVPRELAGKPVHVALCSRGVL